jgi:polysaccharide biosynthesis transport protein
MKDFRNLSVYDYLRIFWRRRWYFVITSFLVTAGVTFYAWKLPHYFVSEARIGVESASIPEDLVRPIARLSAEERISALREQLYSRSFLEKVIEELQPSGYESRQGFVMEEAVSLLRKRIQALSPSRNIMTISYSSTSPNDAQAMVARLVSGLIQGNISTRQTKARVTDQFIEGQFKLAERDLIDLENKIKAFKNSHLGQLPEQATVNLAALSRLQTMLAAQDTALQQLQEHRYSLEIRLREQGRLRDLSKSVFSEIQPKSTQPGLAKPLNPSPLELQLAAKRTQLEELMTKYMPNHPDVERLAREVQVLEKQADTQSAAAAAQNPASAETPATTVQPDSQSERSRALASEIPGFESILGTSEIKLELERNKTEIARALKSQEELSGQIATIQGRLNMAPALEQEYGALTRDYENRRQQYRALQEKKFQVEIASDAESDKRNDAFSIIDAPSLPEKPAFPNRTMIALAGLGVGILLGLGAAFGREYLDSTLASESEAASTLKIPVLASILEIPDEGSRFKKSA